MTILDTNVISALVHPSPEPVVVAWLDRQTSSAVWITAVTEFEIRTGLDLLPDGRRRRHLEGAFAHFLEETLQRRVLPFDREAAEIAGRLAADRRRHGFTVEVRDTQIAGIVLARQALLATRKVRDFRDLGARVVNPWEAD